MDVRTPVVSGSFYPEDPTTLYEKVNWFISQGKKKIPQSKNFYAGMAPHAGYMFSGQTAGVFYASINQTIDTAIILGPNHTGLGAPVSLDTSDAWLTPLGKTFLNKKISEKLLKYSVVTPDHSAHIMEHSIEVHVPFLQTLNKDIKIVPLCIKTHSFKDAKDTANALYNVTKGYENIIVIASTDMTHYEKASLAEKLDSLAFQQIKKLDPQGLYNTVIENNISMCGFMPVVITMLWSQMNGAHKGEILDYTNSGMVTGDLDEVVAYAAGIFF